MSSLRDQLDGCTRKSNYPSIPPVFQKNQNGLWLTGRPSRKRGVTICWVMTQTLSTIAAHTYTHVWTACVKRNQRHMMRKNKAQHPTDDGLPPKKVLGIFCFLVMCTQLLLTCTESLLLFQCEDITHSKSSFYSKNYGTRRHCFSGWRIELSSCPVGMEQLDGLLHLSKGGKTFEEKLWHTECPSYFFSSSFVQHTHHQALRCTVYVILHDCTYERRGCRHRHCRHSQPPKIYKKEEEGKTHSTEKKKTTNQTRNVHSCRSRSSVSLEVCDEIYNACRQLAFFFFFS